MHIPFALINLKDGLENGNALPLLRKIFSKYAATGTQPSILAINEARWKLPRGIPSREALEILETIFGGYYEIRIGEIERSDNPPAIVWDTRVWHLLEESVSTTDHHRWGRNSWTLVSREDPNYALRVIVPHLDYASGTRRVMEAEILAAQLGGHIPVVVAGDMNSTASGPHLPHRDYAREPQHKRRQKGRLLSSGEWVDDTRALDTLIGPWDPAAGTRRHDNGAGLKAMAEIDWEQRGRPPQELLAPTTYHGQSLLIDWILATKQVGLVPGTYRVWDGDPTHTDHKLVTATLALS